MWQNLKTQHTEASGCQLSHLIGKDVTAAISILLPVTKLSRAKMLNSIDEVVESMVKLKALKLEDFVNLSLPKKIEYIEKAWKVGYPEIFGERRLFEDIMGNYRYKKVDGWGHTSDIASNFKAIDFYRDFVEVGKEIFSERAVSMKTTSIVDVDKWLTPTIKKNIDDLKDAIGSNKGINWADKTLYYNKAEIHIFMPKGNLTPTLMSEWMQRLTLDYPDITFVLNSLEDFIN